MNLERIRLGLLCLNAGLLVSNLASWVLIARQDGFVRADFTAYYSGWMLIAEGRSDLLYDLQAQGDRQRLIMEGRQFQGGVLPFNYPPNAGLFLAPLAWFSRMTAFYVWTVVQVGFLAVILMFLHRQSRGLPQADRWGIVVACLAFHPVLLAFQHGTFAIFTTFCLTLCVWMLPNHPRVAGFALAMGSFKPQMLVLPGSALVGNRRWSALIAAVVSMLFIMMITSMILGYHVWPEFFQRVKISSQQFGALGIDPRDMTNFKGFLAAIMGTEPSALPWIQALTWLGLIGSSLLIIKQGISRQSDFQAVWATGLIFGLVFSPHSNLFDGISAILAAALMLNQARFRQSTLWLMQIAPIVSALDLFASSKLPIPVHPLFLFYSVLAIISVNRLAQNGSDAQATGQAQPAEQLSFQSLETN